MSLVTAATLWMFGALFAGCLFGFLVGKVTRFEIGLGMGLLVPGVVCLWFAAQCLIEYRAFLHAGPYGAWGEVTAVEDRPVNAAGDITQPVPVIRFTAPDDSVHTIRGPGSSGLKVGDAVSVIFNPAEPERSRIGQLSELRGGAIAMLLFGTFPFSFGLWFLYAYASGRAEHGKDVKGSKRVVKGATSAATESRSGRLVPGLLFLAMFGATIWIGAGAGALEQRFVQGFGSIAAVLLGYAIWGAATRRGDSTWSVGVAVLALNFGVWAFALHLLVG